MKNPEQLIDELKKVLGGRLQSVLLYGSAARGEMTQVHSDYDLLVVVANLSFETLELMRPTLKRWSKQGHPLPVLFTATELATAKDVFPIEFLEMKETAKVLYGPNPLNDFLIDTHHLRYQLEHELRSKLILLRSSLIMSVEKPAHLRETLGKFLSGFSALFAAVLRLEAVPVPLSRVAIWEELHKRAPIDLDALQTILRWRQTGRNTPDDPVDVAQRFLSSVEAVVHFIDRR